MPSFKMIASDFNSAGTFNLNPTRAYELFDGDETKKKKSSSQRIEAAIFPGGYISKIKILRPAVFFLPFLPLRLFKLLFKTFCI